MPFSCSNPLLAGAQTLQDADKAILLNCDWDAGDSESDDTSRAVDVACCISLALRLGLRGRPLLVRTVLHVVKRVDRLLLRVLVVIVLALVFVCGVENTCSLAKHLIPKSQKLDMYTFY